MVDALKYHTDVLVHSGKFDCEFIEKHQITAILSDRNGFIIPKSIIDVLNGQIFNTHPSLLPLHRGWQPIFFSVLENTQIGVSIHQVNAGLDKGLLACQEKIAIDSRDTLRTLHIKCRTMIIDLIKSNWSEIVQKKLRLINQTGPGCYHSSKEFNYYFDKLYNKWDSSVSDVQHLR